MADQMAIHLNSTYARPVSYLPTYSSRLATLPGNRRAQRHRNGRFGNHQPVHVGPRGATYTTDHHKRHNSDTTGILSVTYVRITVSSSARNGLVGAGGAIVLPATVYGSQKLGTFSSTLGPRSEQNPVSGELAATERALGTLPPLRSSRIELSTRSKAAVLTLRQPRRRSGQQHIRHIYESITAINHFESE